MSWLLVISLITFPLSLWLMTSIGLCIYIHFGNVSALAYKLFVSLVALLMFERTDYFFSHQIVVWVLVFAFVMSLVIPNKETKAKN